MVFEKKIGIQVTEVSWMVCEINGVAGPGRNVSGVTYFQRLRGLANH
jgi:hypothetical protein